MSRHTRTIEELLPLARKEFSEMEIAKAPLEVLPLLEEYRKRRIPYSGQIVMLGVLLKIHIPLSAGCGSAGTQSRSPQKLL
jgi:hypothetical protein